MRLSCGIAEFDRVLGGGLVAGSLVLIGGNPGIGKSTLLLQAMDLLAKWAGNVLYVSGEESAQQIRLRGTRMGVNARSLFILAETSLEKIIDPHSPFKAGSRGGRFHSDGLHLGPGVGAGERQPGAGIGRQADDACQGRAGFRSCWSGM